MVRLKNKTAEAGLSLIEVTIAIAILTIGSLAMIGLMIASIAAAGRNRIDGAQALLAESVVEKINSNILGQRSTSITDCDGIAHPIDTTPGGANLNAGENAVDFDEDIETDESKASYHMDYVLNTPCGRFETPQAVYDVRWNVQKVGGSERPTNTYLLTVSIRLKDRRDSDRFSPPPVTLRAMFGVTS